MKRSLGILMGAAVLLAAALLVAAMLNKGMEAPVIRETVRGLIVSVDGGSVVLQEETADTDEAGIRSASLRSIQLEKEVKGTLRVGDEVEMLVRLSPSSAETALSVTVLSSGNAVDASVQAHGESFAPKS